LLSRRHGSFQLSIRHHLQLLSDAHAHQPDPVSHALFRGIGVPNPIKAAYAVVLSLAVWPWLSFPGTIMPASPWMLA
jgi:hypothetical protein